MKSNHDVLKEFHKAVKKHRKVCFRCESEQKYKFFLEQLKRKYVYVQDRGLVIKMVENFQPTISTKQMLFEYLAFNE